MITYPINTSNSTVISTPLSEGQSKTFSSLMFAKKVTIQDLLEEIAIYEDSQKMENSSCLSQVQSEGTDCISSEENTSSISYSNIYPSSCLQQEPNLQSTFSNASLQKRKVGRPPKSSFFNMESFQAFLNACAEGNIEQVELLSKKGLTCDQVYHQTLQEPILLAVENGNFELFCILLRQYHSYGERLVFILSTLANASTPNDSITEAIKTIEKLVFGENPLFISCLFNQHEQLHRQLKGLTLERKVLEQLIDVSCKFSANECLKILLNCQEKHKKDTLAEKVYFSSSSEELSEPKTVLTKRKRGRPPKNPNQAIFFQACREGDLETLKFLPQSEYNLTSFSSEGLNGLHIAANKGNASIVDFLLKKTKLEINPNLPSKHNGNTALHFAARKGFPEVVAMLLHAGADNSIKNDANQTAHDLASNAKVMQLLAPKISNSQIETNSNTTSSQEDKKRPKIPFDGNLYLLYFPTPTSTSSPAFLLRQTNQIMKRLGGLRKYTYRALPTKLATEEQYKMLQSHPLTLKIINSLTKDAVYLMEYRPFVNFFASEYTHRITDITLPIQRIDFSLPTTTCTTASNKHSLQMYLTLQQDSSEGLPPPKLARKFTPNRLE